MVWLCLYLWIVGAFIVRNLESHFPPDDRCPYWWALFLWPVVPFINVFFWVLEKARKVWNAI